MGKCATETLFQAPSRDVAGGAMDAHAPAKLSGASGEPLTRPCGVVIANFLGNYTYEA